MSKVNSDCSGAKIIELPRWGGREGQAGRTLSRRDQLVTSQIVGILKDLLLSLRLPSSSDPRV